MGSTYWNHVKAHDSTKGYMAQDKETVKNF